MKTKLITENVWSAIKDTDKSNINNSPIWSKCYKDEEMDDETKSLNNTWYRYTVKFDGPKPVQVTGMKTIKSHKNENENKKRVDSSKNRR